jgi:hypothetical protein
VRDRFPRRCVEKWAIDLSERYLALHVDFAAREVVDESAVKNSEAADNPRVGPGLK